MEDSSKIKTWISEKAPSLAILYKNKYVGMVYDRFASLPQKNKNRSFYIRSDPSLPWF